MTSGLHTALRAAAILIGIAATGAPLQAAEALTNPLLGNAEAQAQGLRFYRTRCYICHLHEGGRGPNLFATKLTDEQFHERRDPRPRHHAGLRPPHVARRRLGGPRLRQIDRQIRMTRQRRPFSPPC